jgi:hypothetical protein
VVQIETGISQVIGREMKTAALRNLKIMSNKNSHTNQHLRQCVRFLVVLILLLLTTSSVMAQGEPELQWELVNPFRFISDRESFDKLRRVYDGLSNDEKTAYALDRKLQALYDADIDRQREDAKKGCNEKSSEKDRKECIEAAKKPYLGWFADLAANDHQKTCWDSKNHKFRDQGECKDYINPTLHKVRVWISNSHLLGGRVPQWFVDNQLQPDPHKCAPKYQKDVCVELEITYDSEELVSREVSVRFSDGSFQIKSLPVLVEDKLIVGLGDSYAAGEGNPDIPAQFTKGKSEKDILFKIKDVPAKDGDTEAGWLERRCHRSMYSYQFKTALQFALTNPQKAVTFVTYSCSGATTGNIIDDKQSPKEGSKIFKITPQLEALKKVLESKTGKPREIDYLLLSTGGNEIGFAKFGAYIVVKGGLSKLFASEDDVKNSEQNSTEILLTGKDNKEGSYPRLHKALLDGKNGIKMKGCRATNPQANNPCPRILLTPYPNIVQDEKRDMPDEKREPCKADRGEFDVSFGEDAGRAKRIKDVKQFVFDPIRKIQKSPIITSTLGWTVITEQLDKYLTHGFCARNDKSLSLTGEKLIVPTKKVNGQWKEFDPRDYRAYETRQRWARIPVDAKLTTDEENWFLKKLRPLLKLLHVENLRLDLALEDDRSNILHPTAEGLAETADANFREIERQEAAKRAKAHQ